MSSIGSFHLNESADYDLDEMTLNVIGGIQGTDARRTALETLRRNRQEAEDALLKKVAAKEALEMEEADAARAYADAEKKIKACQHVIMRLYLDLRALLEQQAELDCDSAAPDDRAAVAKNKRDIAAVKAKVKST